MHENEFSFLWDNRSNHGHEVKRMVKEGPEYAIYELQSGQFAVVEYSCCWAYVVDTLKKAFAVAHFRTEGRF